MVNDMNCMIRLTEYCYSTLGEEIFHIFLVTERYCLLNEQRYLAKISSFVTLSYFM